VRVAVTGVADHGDFGDAVATGCGANEVVW